MNNEMKKTGTKKNVPKWLPHLLDFGPLFLFFVTNWLAGSKNDPVRGPIAGTAIFMVAITISLIISKVKIGRISPMMWVSAVLVLGFGSLTLWFRDPKFIQVKPTLIYLSFAAILLGGLLRKKALLRYLLQFAFHGVDDHGWRKLSRNWGLFFIMMAGLNELLRNDAWFSFDTWLLVKTWGVTVLFFIFNMTQVPMLMQHGLKIEGDEANETGQPD